MKIIYEIVNKINGKVYVGQTKNFEQRMKNHYSDSKRVNNHRGQTPLYEDVRLYGWENFKSQIIEVVEEHRGDEVEEHYIKSKKAHYTLGGYNKSLKAKALRDERIKEECLKTRLPRMSKFMTDLNNQRWKCEKYRKEMSKQSRELQYERLKDKDYKETVTKRLKKATDKMKLEVCQYTKDGKLIACYNGLREAGRQTGIAHQTIGKVANGDKHRKTAGGFVWKYSQKEEV